MILFTADWCSNCKPVKIKLNAECIVFREISMDTVEGVNKARELGIRGIPSLVDGDTVVTGQQPCLEYINDKCS